MPEWALLGSIYEAKSVKPGALTDILDVRAPLISAMLDQLEAKSLVQRAADPNDSRAKFVTLTKTGKTLVTRTEKLARAFLLKYLSGVKPTDLLAYLRVVEFLANK